ncbi:Methyl-accepting chemotaxis protein II [Gemmata sp. SH-PL17]|uniref:methyl-accepting chemotaxis protein n=1 Tax=Gemmata sp. SH-PL17 TaxID=1630693 RepID=UPI00078E6332|nr:methyl-accepting chemotaxis protein [Gemmata sp. SH-PL17]AMV28209.1 Methyl-accepting chemotaxis protein II [Gemmata sp. SH-PL17]
MNWFRNQTVMAKLLLGFSAVCGIVAASGALGYRGLSTSREGMRVLYADYTVAGTDLAKASVNLARFRNNMVFAVSARDQQTVDRILGTQRGLREQITSGLDAYAATELRVSHSGRDERKDLDKVRAGVKAYFEAADQTAQALQNYWRADTDKEREGHKQKMTAAMFSAGPKFETATAAIDELIQTVTEVARDINEDGNAAARSAQQTLIGGTTCAGLASMFIGLALARAITRPLVQTVAVLEAVANGDLTPKVEAHSRDELGRMAAALNATTSGIRTALGQDRVDWQQVGKQRELNADYAVQIAAISRSQVVIEFKMDGTITNANENFLRTTGYGLSEIQGRHHSMFVDRGYAAGPEYGEFWAKLNRGEPITTEFKRTSKDGKEVWIQASYNPILDLNGKPYKVVKYATDVTAAKKLEQKVKNDAAELQHKVAAITVSVSALAAGDFTQEAPDLGNDTVGQMAAALNKAVVSVRTALEGVREVSEQLADASGQLASASNEISTGAQEQASSLEETASTLEEITATVRQNSDSAQQARQLASNSKDIAERGGQVVGNAVDAMSEINHSSKKISEIITTIDEIAFQTNLLALNAAVEAARAGEQGRGFAVVASEVRNLAQRSATAAKEIKALIEDSVKKVDAGTELVNRSGATLGDIVTSVKRVTDIVTEIAAASKEQSTGIDQVNKAVSQMDSVTQRNASQTEEVSATAESLTDQAGQLRDLVARFKLGDERAAPRPGAKPTRAKAPATKPRSAVTRALNKANSSGTGRSHELDRLGNNDGGFTEF